MRKANEIITQFVADHRLRELMLETMDVAMSMIRPTNPMSSATNMFVYLSQKLPNNPHGANTMATMMALFHSHAIITSIYHKVGEQGGYESDHAIKLQGVAVSGVIAMLMVLYKVLPSHTVEIEFFSLLSSSQW